MQGYNDLVLALAIDGIDDLEPARSPVQADFARNVDAEASVALVPARKQILLVAGPPGRAFGLRIVLEVPEIAGIEAVHLRAIDSRRVVRRGRTKLVSLLERGRIDERAAVYDDWRAGEPGFERQRVIVPVAAAAGEAD